MTSKMEWNEQYWIEEFVEEEEMAQRNSFHADGLGQTTDEQIEIRWDEQLQDRYCRDWVDPVSFSLTVGRMIRPSGGYTDPIRDESWIIAARADGEDICTRCDCLLDLIVGWMDMYPTYGITSQYKPYLLEDLDVNKNSQLIVMQAYFRLWGQRPSWPTCTSPPSLDVWESRCCWRYHFGWGGFTRIFRKLDEMLVKFRDLKRQMFRMRRDLTEQIVELDDMKFEDDGSLITDTDNIEMFEHTKEMYLKWRDGVNEHLDDIIWKWKNMNQSRNHLFPKVFARLFANGVWTRLHHNGDEYYVQVRSKLPQYTIKFEGMDRMDEGGSWDRRRRVWHTERYSERYPDRRKTFKEETFC